MQAQSEQQYGSHCCEVMNRAVVTIKNETFWTEGDIVCVRKNCFGVLFRVGVLQEGEEGQHVIVDTSTFEISLEECYNLNRELREKGVETTISFEIGDSKGQAKVIAGLDRSFDPFSVAAAVAVVKASCGWDESPRMTIHINGAEIAILPRFEDGKWFATTLMELE